MYIQERRNDVKWMRCWYFDMYSIEQEFLNATRG